MRGGGCRELKESAGVQPRVWPVSVCKSMSLDRGRSTAWDPCWIRFCGEAGATIFMVFPENDAAERCRGCWVGLQIGTCLSASCSPYQQPRALQLVLAFGAATAARVSRPSEARYRRRSPIRSPCRSRSRRLPSFSIKPMSPCCKDPDEGRNGCPLLTQRSNSGCLPLRRCSIYPPRTLLEAEPTANPLFRSTLLPALPSAGWST